MYVLPIERRNEASGIDPLRYKAATMELSSYLHSHPSALHRLWSFVAGSDEALQMTTIAMRYATSFLARSILGARPLLGVPIPKEWSETEEMLSLGRHIWTSKKPRGLPRGFNWRPREVT